MFEVSSKAQLKACFLREQKTGEQTKGKTPETLGRGANTIFTITASCFSALS